MAFVALVMPDVQGSREASNDDGGSKEVHPAPLVRDAWADWLLWEPQTCEAHEFANSCDSDEQQYMVAPPAKRKRSR